MDLTLWMVIYRLEIHIVVKEGENEYWGQLAVSDMFHIVALLGVMGRSFYLFNRSEILWQ